MSSTQKHNSKKSSKGREKKLKRKQGQVETDLAWAKVKQAYEMGNFMDSLLPFKKFERNNICACIEYLTIHQMTEEAKQWCFRLLKENMKTQYIDSGWGWKDHEKRDELTHDSSCFLLARDTVSSQYIGFISFRFDLDQGIEVLYCYEIQLIPEVRRKGLGKFLMQILELISHKANMRKVMLTVFKDNAASNSFFRNKMGYTEDETSPSVYDPYNGDDYSYFILSKSTQKTATGPPPLITDIPTTQVSATPCSRTS